MPDGCRDVIGCLPDSGAPNWRLSPLYDSAVSVQLKAGEVLLGFRLLPGAVIDERALFQRLANLPPDEDHICEAISENARTDPFVADALEGLSEIGASVAGVAKRMGVSRRMVERRLCSATDRPPTYWLQLARIRRAARQLSLGRSLSDLAIEAGFSDQSHMNREFRRWFGITPTQFRASEHYRAVIMASGYDTT